MRDSKFYLFLVFAMLFVSFSENVYALESVSTKYHYDDNGRLTYTESSKGYYLFQYDKNGNLIKKVPLQYQGNFEAPANADITSPFINLKGGCPISRFFRVETDPFHYSKPKNVNNEAILLLLEDRCSAFLVVCSLLQ